MKKFENDETEKNFNTIFVYKIVFDKTFKIFFVINMNEFHTIASFLMYSVV